MARFDGVLLVSDFDDTLVDREKRVPERTREALRYFTEHGGRFTLASGRGLEAVRPQLQGLPVSCPVIVANGTQIYDFSTEQMVYEARLPQTAREDFARVFQAFPTVAVEIYADGQLYCVNPNAVTWEHLRITGQTARQSRLEEIPDPWVYAKFEEEQTVLRKLQHFLNTSFPGRYEAIFSNTYLLEVAPGGCGKGPGVLRLAELLGISRVHIYCAGDNENDLSMLAVAERGFVPAGSTEAALRAADVVVCDCNQGAIADVVEYLRRRYTTE